MITHKASERDREKLLASLSAVDYDGKHRKLKRVRHEGTGEWFIQCPEYMDWKNSRNSSCLCCHGIRMLPLD